MSFEEEAADILETTADRFATGEYSWTKGNFRTEWGYCVLGGMAKTANVLTDVAAGSPMPFRETTPFGVAARAASVTLGKLQDHTWGPSVADWNDEEERTVDEVVDLLKHTAKDLRNG